MFLLRLPPTLYSVCFLHVVPCVMILFALDPADGISWLAAPDEHIYVEQGSPFTLHWHYRMDENETLLSSDIEQTTVHVKEQFMASRHKGDDKYYIYQREGSSFSIFGKNNVSLIVHRAKIGHNVTYCCGVVWRSIAAGNRKERRCSNVFVYAVPRISYLKPHMSCKQGDLIKLQCNATGIPKPHVHWIHDDTQELIDSSADIHVLNITGKRSEGRYCCDANNGFGRKTECTTVIVTEYEPENTTLLVKQINIDDVNIIHIECKADASPPSNHFIIFFNDKEYNSSDGLQTIEVRAPRNNKRNEIAFSCIPCNKYGQGPIEKVILQLYASTKSSEITNPYKQVLVVDAGEYVSLVCNASGYPVPNITWTMNGTLIGVGRITNLRRAKRNDTSCYTCTADNGIGQAKNATICLNVQYYSLISKEENDTLVAVLGVLFALSIVLNIIFIVGFLWLRRKDSRENSGERSIISDERGQMNGIALQETSFNSAENVTQNIQENEPIGRRGLATSNEGMPEYEEVAARTPPPQPQSGVQTNNLMPQYESADGQGQTGAVVNPPPVTYQTIQPRTGNPMPQYESADEHGQTEAVVNPPPDTYQTIQPRTGDYGSLSPLTRLPPKDTVLSSTGSPTRTGEYQALQHKGVSPQYQSLDDLSKC